ncbi:CG14964, partial [Drosophila busckii]
KNLYCGFAERPSPPGRPILTPLAPSEQQPDVVNLRWSRPLSDGGSPITGYIVEQRRVGSPHWVRATPTPIERCEIQISGLEPGWRYEFRCFAENIVGRSDASELSDALTVTLQRNAICVPRFIDELLDMDAVEDERIEFRVRIQGEPPPEVSWFKDGYEIFSSRRTKILHEHDSSVLVIHQVALTDEGEIKCSATNRAGHVVTKCRLQVQAPPKIRLPRAYEDGLIVEAEEVVRLKVGVAGQPPPAITWLHESEVIAPSARFEISNTEKHSLLKIDGVQRADRGEYMVRAWNRLGEDITSFLVTVTARPNAPGQPRLNMSFGKSATLSWTAPLDDGGCKIGNYIVEYFRMGWNVWLKAATTRALSTTLHDLIEGSEYKFRVKAENPYGLSEPSPESELLFIPDPKRGITKPKSASKINTASEPAQAAESNKSKPTPPRRKALSPPRPQSDAATSMAASPKHSPRGARKPQLIDSEQLHQEMSYGTSDQALKQHVRKSPDVSALTGSAPKLNLTIVTTTALPEPAAVQAPPPRSPIRFFNPKPQNLANSKDISPARPALATPAPLPLRKSPTPPEPIKFTPALQRSAEPVQLEVNQHVRRYSGHALSPAKNVPALAIAIATSATALEKLPNPIIEISAPPPPPPTPQITLPALDTSASEPTPPVGKLRSTEKHDEVHTSNEFMLVVFDKNSKVKDKDKQDSFELELEDAIQPPPISISAPDLAFLEFTNLHTTFPLRRSVSSTELLYERAMARFYEAVELEQAAKQQKQQPKPEKQAATPATGTTFRKRLGSMTEAERASFERRSELRRQSADMVSLGRKWDSRENVNMLNVKNLSRHTSDMMQQEQRHLREEQRQLREEQQPDEEEEEEERTESTAEDSEDMGQDEDEYEQEEEQQARQRTQSDYDMGSDYTESTASSEQDSIEKFKMELLARTRSPSPKDLETYHPRNMAGNFTPYRAPTPEQAAVVLNRPMPLPSPDFVPKPILKRSSNEHMDLSPSNVKEEPSLPVTATPKLDLAKGIKSFFSRDKRSATEKNTEANEELSNPLEQTNALAIAAELENKRKVKEQEELRRQEQERLMHEEAIAAVDHYSDLVREVSSSHKYHKPLYLDRDELKRAAERAEQEEEQLSEQGGVEAHRQQRQMELLAPPVVSRERRLSISEREQLVHVRDAASKLATIETCAPLPMPPTPATPPTTVEPPEYPAVLVAAPPKPKNKAESESESVMSELVEARPDARGRTRLVKVKRVIKRRVPSSTRSRDASLNRSLERPSLMAAKILSAADQELLQKAASLALVQSEEQAHEKVRSALSYSTDLVLFLVACYVYLFKDARLVLPILALMIYRQLGEAISAYIPSWMRRKRNED